MAVVLAVARFASAQDNAILFKLEQWEPRGLVESTRVHIAVDKGEEVRLLGEGGNVDKDGKRWGRPAELVRVELPANENEPGKLLWSRARHTFIAEPGWGVAWSRGDVGRGSLPGGEHILHGSGRIFSFRFSSEESYPLTFKFVSGRGYLYMCGKGTLTTPAGKEISLGAGDKIDEWPRFLTDEDQIMRERASQALGYLTSCKDTNKAAVLKALSAALLTDAAMEVRRNCAQALGRIGDKTALDALNKVRPEEHEWVRTVVQEAVSRLLGSTR